MVAYNIPEAFSMQNLNSLRRPRPLLLSCPFEKLHVPDYIRAFAFGNAVIDEEILAKSTREGCQACCAPILSQLNRQQCENSCP